MQFDECMLLVVCEFDSFVNGLLFLNLRVLALPCIWVIENRVDWDFCLLENVLFGIILVTSKLRFEVI